MFVFRPIDYGLRFDRCNSIHMFFCFQKIDVVMTDQNGLILYTFPNVKPWQIILPKRQVYTTFELPLGSCIKYRVGTYFPNDQKND